LGVGPKINNKFAVILLNYEQGKLLHNTWLNESINILKMEKNNDFQKD
jgi:hypothetical protein